MNIEIGGYRIERAGTILVFTDNKEEAHRFIGGRNPTRLPSQFRPSPHSRAATVFLARQRGNDHTDDEAPQRGREHP